MAVEIMACVKTWTFWMYWYSSFLCCFCDRLHLNVSSSLTLHNCHVSCWFTFSSETQSSHGHGMKISLSVTLPKTRKCVHYNFRSVITCWALFLAIVAMLFTALRWQSNWVSVAVPAIVFYFPLQLTVMSMPCCLCIGDVAN